MAGLIPSLPTPTPRAGWHGSRIRRRLQKVSLWDRIGSEVLHVQQRRIIAHVPKGFHGKPTSIMSAKLTKCSSDTALRNMKIFVEWRVLQQEDADSRSTIYALGMPM